MKNAKIWENVHWKIYFNISKQPIDINYVNSDCQVSNKYFQYFIAYVINFTDDTKPLPFKKVKYRSFMLEKKW